jgi:hypothetical protein
LGISKLIIFLSFPDGPQPFLSHEHGYYYPDFAPDTGGGILFDAFDTHDRQLPAYKENCIELIAKLAPTNRTDIELHERLLAAPVLNL